MKYLSAEEVLILHDRIIEETGGAHGLRDIGLLLSALERARAEFGGKERYPDLFTKAGSIFESIARNHAFIDGNKRTAMAATARFLFANGYDLAARNMAL